MLSVYALSKYDQERLCLMVGSAYEIPTVALRFFNVYGPHQALSNPYSGVLAIFAARLLNERPPLIFEDGEQRRDFVYAGDVAEACRLAMEVEGAIGRAFNIGSGRPVTIKEVARLLADTLGVPIEPEITGECRIGDVRHCFPDIGAARRARLSAENTVQAGLAELVGWLKGRVAVDRVGEARAALAGSRAHIMTVSLVRPASRRPVLITGGAGFIVQGIRQLQQWLSVNRRTAPAARVAGT